MDKEVNLNPADEFSEESKGHEVADKPEIPPGVSKTEYDQLQQVVAAQAEELKGMKSTQEVLGRIKEIFTGVKPESMDPRDEFVRKELLRLVPELQHLPDIAKIIPAIVDTLGASAEERVFERTVQAQDFAKDLMKKDGLNSADDETFSLMEEALTTAIKNDKDLLAMWTRGNVKGAVTKAYEKISSKILAPARASGKRSAVQVISEGPKAAPRGGAPSPAGGGKPKVDFGDTSNAGKKAIHEAAFDRLVELTQE